MSFLEELCPENEEEINQLAKKALRKARQRPEPTTLYWLQLVRWALDCGELNSLNDHLLLFLELLEGSEPITVMNYLEGSDTGELLMLADDSELEPVELADVIIAHLDKCMMEKVEGYQLIAPLDPAVEDCSCYGTT